MAIFSLPLLAAPVPKTAGRTGPNSNALIKAHAGKCTFDASTEYNSWPVAKAFDEDTTTSWFSAHGDSPMNSTQPWLRVTFPQDVNVSRVTILGNREPQWPTGYSILAGKLELLDEKGGVLASAELTAAGDKKDFEWTISRGGVRAVRLTATKDEGQNGCVAVSEFQVE
jgi:hypothetical protein